MPDMVNQVLNEADNGQEANHDQDMGSWTRKRLVRTENGQWTRIGRLRRVFYRT